MLCRCLRRKLNELPELIFPLVILLVSVILLFIGIIINIVYEDDYNNIGGGLITIGGIFTLIISACLCSVWDGKYRNKKKSVKVIPIRKIVIKTVCIKCQPKYQHNKYIRNIIYQ
jgi:hypothetical protein